MMNNLTSKKIFKTISFMLVIIFITNVFIPIYSYADEDEETGGKLFKPIFKLFAGVGDLVIKGLQRIFIGNGDIKGEGINEIEQEGAFLIRYSPGIIFSNTVPGLNANFINPSEDKEATKAEIKWEKVEDDIKFNETTFAEEYGYSDDKSTYTTTSTDGEWHQTLAGKEHAIITWTDDNGVSYKYIITNIDLKTKDWTHYGLAYLNPILGILGSVKTIDIIFHKITDKDGTLYKNDPKGKITNVTKADGTTKMVKSTSKELQKSISKWYKALRLVALVGLLSVLVYVGIRIIISSTGQEKAKYKKMIMDWLAAICILFVLQYIMAFTMSIVENLINIFKTNVVGPNGEDILMTSIRQAIGDSQTYSNTFTDLILYLVLVVYTVIFTVHYLKRLVYLAFFTMIAPLIALTYPLDKIKDGQAQAFTMWLREYVFNALIPVIHILLYTIFVGSAMDFAQQNPIYAIVCIGFLIPAEKFVRKMFGFDKATTSSQIGAAAGGAMVMNAINKIGSKGPAGNNGKGPSGGENSSPKGIRAPSGNPLAAVSGGNPSPGGNPPTGRRGTVRPPKKGSGIGGLIKNQTFTRKAAQRNLAALAGLGGKALGATVGIATGVATGDFSNVFKYGTAGFVAGGAAGKGLVNKGFNTFDSARSGIDNLRYGYNESAYGTEYAQNELFDRQFKRSKEYKDMVSKYKDRPEIKNEIQDMLNAGISDPARMNTILNNLNTTKYSGMGIDKAIGYNELANQCSDSVLYDDKKLKDFLDKRGINADDSVRQTIKQAMVDFK